MPARVRGYHYVRTAGGKKKRVYGSGASAKRRSYGARASGVRYGTVYGRGTYYAKRGSQSGRPRSMLPKQSRSRRGGGFLTLGFGGTDPPKMAQSSNGVVISHREYIQDVTSSTPFIGENFALNPGIKQTFPWLSEIADNFEEWIPEAIIFEFKTTSSNTVVNTTNSNPGLGTLIIATQYNSLNNDFGNKQQMENYENAVSTDPSRSLIHGIECAKGQTPVQPMYVRKGELPIVAGKSNDLRFYDLGKTTVATVGQQTNNFVIGELWISYRIRFLKPRIQTGIGNDEEGVIDHFEIITGGVGPQNVLPLTPFGTRTTYLAPVFGSTLGGVLSGGIVAVADQFLVPFPPSLGGPAGFPAFAFGNGSVQGVQVPSTANTYYFPPGITSGNFLVQYFGEWNTPGVAPVLASAPSILANGCALVNLFNGEVAGASNFQTNQITGNATTQNLLFTMTVKVSANYARFQLAGSVATAMADVDHVDMFVYQLPPALV